MSVVDAESLEELRKRVKEMEKAQKKADKKDRKRKHGEDSRSERKKNKREKGMKRCKTEPNSLSETVDGDDDGIEILKEVKVAEKQVHARALVKDEQLDGDDVAVSGAIRRPLEDDKSDALLKSICKKDQIDIADLGAACTSLVQERGSSVFHNLANPFRDSGLRFDLDRIAKHATDLKALPDKEDLAAIAESVVGLAAAMFLTNVPAQVVRSSAQIVGTPDIRNLNPAKEYYTKEDAVFKRTDLEKIFLLTSGKKKDATVLLTEFYRLFFHRCCKSPRNIVGFTWAASRRNKKGMKAVSLPDHIKDDIKEFGVDLIGVGLHMVDDIASGMVRRDWLPLVDKAMKSALRLATDGTFTENGIFVARPRTPSSTPTKKVLKPLKKESNEDLSSSSSEESEESSSSGEDEETSDNEENSSTSKTG